MVRLSAVEFGLEVEGVLEMDPVLGVEWVLEVVQRRLKAGRYFV
jgi:hypothetical protein